MEGCLDFPSSSKVPLYPLFGSPSFGSQRPPRFLVRALALELLSPLLFEPFRRSVNSLKLPNFNLGPFGLSLRLIPFDGFAALVAPIFCVALWTFDPQSA